MTTIVVHILAQKVCCMHKIQHTKQQGFNKVNEMFLFKRELFKTKSWREQVICFHRS